MNRRTRPTRWIPSSSVLVVFVLLGMILVPVECDATSQLHSIFLAPSAVRVVVTVSESPSHQPLAAAHHGQENSASGDENLNGQPPSTSEADRNQSSSSLAPGQPTPMKSTAVEHTPAVVLVDSTSRFSSVDLWLSVLAPAVSPVGLDISPEPPPPRILASSLAVSL